MSIMLPSESTGYTGPGNWRANDLHPDEVSTPLLHRFLSKFTPGPDDACWPWEGLVWNTGYGVASQTPFYLAHRLSLVVFSGQPLLNGLTVDHLCFNRLCVNPNHLEAVTLAENFRRARVHYGYSERPGAPDDRWTCPDCGTVTRVDGARRHRRRKHGLAAAPKMKRVA